MTVFSKFVQSTLAARITCIVLLAALAGLTTDAFLKIAYGTPAPAGVPLAAAEPIQALPNWLAGANTAGMTVPSDLKLLGVVAQGASGIALIQIMGKRAQTVQVGQRLADGTVLKSVQGKTATVLINNELRTLSLDTVGIGGAPLAVNTATAPPMPVMAAVAMPDMAAQTAQQMQLAQQLQQLQQAAAIDAAASQGNNEATPVNAVKRKLGARP